MEFVELPSTWHVRCFIRHNPEAQFKVLLWHMVRACHAVLPSLGDTQGLVRIKNSQSADNFSNCAHI